MQYIKKYESFFKKIKDSLKEPSKISLDEVKLAIDDILVTLKDDSFRYTIDIHNGSIIPDSRGQVSFDKKDTLVVEIEKDNNTNFNISDIESTISSVLSMLKSEFDIIPNVGYRTIDIDDIISFDLFGNGDDIQPLSYKTEGEFLEGHPPNDDLISMFSIYFRI